MAGAGDADLADLRGEAELVGGARVRVRDGLAPEGATDELDVIPLDVSDDENVHLGEEVEREFVVRVAQDALLDQDDVGAGLLDLLAQAEDVLALLPEQAVHGSVVGHDDVVLHVGLGRGQAELDQSDLRTGMHMSEQKGEGGGEQKIDK